MTRLEFILIHLIFILCKLIESIVEHKNNTYMNMHAQIKHKSCALTRVSSLIKKKKNSCLK